MAGVVVLGAARTPAARADVVWYVNDYPGFVTAVGEGLQVIDFETLPDGSPSYAGALITPEFNYTDQGATFSSPRPVLGISGSVLGHSLEADSYPYHPRNWITAELVGPRRRHSLSRNHDAVALRSEWRRHRSEHLWRRG
ncbi:MAG TPA: hypothetical protein PKK06_17975 [Phycisphaerae bacterium]|nr:hypothetical protein [Phycisphaerae bacterium]